ncbi:hypothetical protein [Clostridium sp.]|uniref:hypothetical protein n=1 Tax=Clostridium sp. TaxID=1506 RepID=UPI003217B514
MKFKFARCIKCRFKERRKDMFPCSECKDGSYPLTCKECRFYNCTNKKGIRTCENFEWD